MTAKKRRTYGCNDYAAHAALADRRFVAMAAAGCGSAAGWCRGQFGVWAAVVPWNAIAIAFSVSGGLALSQTCIRLAKPRAWTRLKPSHTSELCLDHNHRRPEYDRKRSRAASRALRTE